MALEPNAFIWYRTKTEQLLKLRPSKKLSSKIFDKFFLQKPCRPKTKITNQ